MPKELTYKQKKYIEGKLQGKTGTDAVIDANYNTSRENARIIASQNNNNLTIREEIKKGLTTLNITPEYLLKRLQYLIDTGDNSQATLNALKFSFELLGFNKEEAQQTAQKLIININKAVIPVNDIGNSANTSIKQD